MPKALVLSPSGLFADARIARHARRWNKGPNRKRGNRRRYNSMNANKDGADHLGWDVTRKDGKNILNSAVIESLMFN